MNLFLTEKDNLGLTREELDGAAIRAIADRPLKKVLILPPDYTRFHSGTGEITNALYHYLVERGASVDIMPAVGTHAPITEREKDIMFGNIPQEKFLAHNWKTDVVKIGEVPAEYLTEITDGLWNEQIEVEVNRLVMDKSYDTIISLGQVVPHEVIGMASHSKNLFVGVGGPDMINKSHMVGAVCDLEKIMGRDHTPVRKLLDYANEHFLKDRPIVHMLTVVTSEQGKRHTHGLFIGEGRECLTEAVKLAQQKNIDFVGKPFKKCVVFLDPGEYKATWVGNKSIYRTRLAMEDGGELIVLAPGVERFGEDEERDALIRKFGFRGRMETLKTYRENEALHKQAAVAAHLIHASVDGRFHVTYAVKNVPLDEVRKVGFGAMDYDEAVRRYDPEKLTYGYNTMPDGEEIYYVPNPSIGLWIDKNRFEKD